MTSFYNSASPSFFNGTEKTYAPDRVWKGSKPGDVKFAPLGANRRAARSAAAQIYHDARRFERQTRKRGKQDGAIGRNGLAILHALLFDFMDYASGRLDPGYLAIAYRANISISSVYRGLVKLKKVGVLNWITRVYHKKIEGAWRKAQDTNAYAVLSPMSWKGFKGATPDAPPLDREAVGRPERVVDPAEDPLHDVVAARRAGASIDTMADMLERRADRLSQMLAKLKPR